MLHIILLILKVLLIILLVVFGLFLAVFLMATLVPVRYRGQGSYYEKPEGSIKITWLLHILSVAVSYKVELAVTVRLFGIKILKDRIEEPLAEAGEGILEFVREDLGYDEPMVSVQEVKPPPEDPKTKMQEDSGQTPASQTQKTDTASQKENMPPQRSDPEKTIFHRLWVKIKLIFHRITNIVKGITVSWKKAGNAKQEFMSFITDEENKKTFHLIVRQAKRLMRHVLPRKLKGHITFGFEDPYTTGQILTGAALFYPLYQNKFSVLPVFDRKIIEGEIAFRGRIRLGVFLTAGIKILLNRNFRTQLKKIMNRGGM